VGKLSWIQQEKTCLDDRSHETHISSELFVGPLVLQGNKPLGKEMPHSRELVSLLMDKRLKGAKGT